MAKTAKKKARSAAKRGNLKRKSGKAGLKGTIGFGWATKSRRPALSFRYFEPDGRVDLDRLVEELRMSRARVAETFGIARETLQRKARADSPKTQARLQEGLEIVNRVTDWAGGPIPAMAWYRSEPIPAFGGRTAESLVKDGKAAAVRDYLDGVALGGFA
jgi:hypothetical protein